MFLLRKSPRSTGSLAARLALWLMACLATAVAHADEAARSNPSEEQELPAFALVREIVLHHFAAMPDYRSGDIISRSEVRPLLETIRLAGWNVRASRNILRSVLPDTDYLVRQLRSDDGRKFMQRVASYPMAYDRLHRLSGLARGRQLVHDLVHDVGGDELIRYLTTSEGGKNLAKQLSRVPRGADFDARTGRIYSRDDLLKRLEREYQLAVAAQNETGQNETSTSGNAERGQR